MQRICLRRAVVYALLASQSGFPGWSLLAGPAGWMGDSWRYWVLPEGRTYTVPEIGTLFYSRLHDPYRNGIVDRRPRLRQTWNTQHQLGILTCSLTRLSGLLHPKMKKAYNHLLTQHAEPNGTHRSTTDAGKCCSACAHGERRRIAELRNKR